MPELETLGGKLDIDLSFLPDGSTAQLDLGLPVSAS